MTRMTSMTLKATGKSSVPNTNMESAIEDEITSINSIYGDDTLCLISKNPPTCTLRLPSHPSIVLRVEFPCDYPDAPPSIIGTETVGDDIPRGAGHKIADAVRDVLATVYRPGEACIYDLLEEGGEALSGHEIFEPHVEEPQGESSEAVVEDGNEALGPEPAWILSSPITEKKSVFVARVAAVESPAQAKRFLRHLVAKDKKVAKATHNITAWRIKGTNETTFQDCDDDGEQAAGGRLLHLMQLMDVWNVMVVVTRWYGGVLLGPDRFRLINMAARDALVKAGFAAGEGETGKKKGKK